MKKILFLFLVILSHSLLAQESDPFLEARKLMYDGDVLFGRDEYVDALSKYDHAYELVKESDSAHLKAELLLDIGLVYDYVGDFEHSLEFYQKSYRIMDSLNDQIYVAAILNNIGTVFFMWGEYDQALEYYIESLEVEKQYGTQNGVADSYQNIATAYRNLGQIDSAMHYFDQSLALYLEVEDSVNIGTCYDNMANLFIEEKDYDKALFYIENAYLIQSNNADKHGQVYSLNNFGVVYLETGDYTLAKKYLLDAVELALEVRMNSQLLFSYEKLAELSSKTGDYKSAFEYLSNAVLYRDSVFSADARRQMAEMQTRFEVDKMNDQIKIHQLTIQQQNEALKRETLIKTLVIVGLVISILFIGFMGWLYFQKRRAYQVLLLQNIQLARLEQKEKPLPQEKQSIEIPETKYQKSSLTDEQKKAIYDKLLELMEFGRVFLNHDLSIEDLADKLDTNRRYLSQVVNEMHGSNFSTFINEYRVKEARRLLLDPEKRHFSLEGIAHAAGFNSRISFNNAFKKITGLTPAYFQKSQKNI
ncbi:MAG: hypothetical protein C0592_13455 [Marinilabiliales bacterium]|nr:MAG: hypothetical protein C0592_13455 [Marinilabiliales bacterium]